jgi:hypothetical protein
MSDPDDPMQDDLIEYDNETTIPGASWQALSIESAKPYIKALGLVTTLLMTWAGLCAI